MTLKGFLNEVPPTVVTYGLGKDTEDFEASGDFEERAFRETGALLEMFYLEAGKLGLKELLTECLQPAPLSPGGAPEPDRVTPEDNKKRLTGASIIC